MRLPQRLGCQLDMRMRCMGLRQPAWRGADLRKSGELVAFILAGVAWNRLPGFSKTIFSEREHPPPPQSSSRNDTWATPKSFTATC